MPALGSFEQLEELQRHAEAELSLRLTPEVVAAARVVREFCRAMLRVAVIVPPEEAAGFDAADVSADALTGSFLAALAEGAGDIAALKRTMDLATARDLCDLLISNRKRGTS